MSYIKGIIEAMHSLSRDPNAVISTALLLGLILAIIVALKL